MMSAKAFRALALCTAAWLEAAASMRVACVGDSITRGDKSGRLASYPTLLGELLGEEYEVLGFGKGGRTAQVETGDAYVETDEYEDAVESGAGIFVSMLGTNDAKSALWDEEAYVEDYTAFLAGLAGLPQEPRIFVLSPPPYVAEEDDWGDLDDNPINTRLEDLVAEIAEASGYVFVNVKSRFDALDDIEIYYEEDDGIHPNEDGNRVIADAVYDALAASSPTYAPTQRPTRSPSLHPTYSPTTEPPSPRPTPPPATSPPTLPPTFAATPIPTFASTSSVPSAAPTPVPTPLPTGVPTTVAPTTASPTTAPPTTVAPTTVAPTTASPTTAAPTTAAPTTASPTTPSTAAPSAAPTSAPPSPAPSPRSESLGEAAQMAASMTLEGVEIGEYGDAEIAAFEETVEDVIEAEVEVTGLGSSRRRLAEELVPRVVIEFLFAGEGARLEAAVADGSFDRTLHRLGAGTALVSASAISVELFAATPAPTPESRASNASSPLAWVLGLVIAVFVVCVVALLLAVLLVRRARRRRGRRHHMVDKVRAALEDDRNDEIELDASPPDDVGDDEDDAKTVVVRLSNRDEDSLASRQGVVDIDLDDYFVPGKDPPL